MRSKKIILESGTKKFCKSQFALVCVQVYTVKQWRWVHHHEEHALMGFFSSPFQRALVLSYDGGGDDGYYKVFYASGSTIQRIARLNANLGCDGGFSPTFSGI